MGTLQATVNGWRLFNPSQKTWYAANGVWTPCSSKPDGHNCLACYPRSNSSTNYGHITIIKVTIPNNEIIGIVKSITISFRVQQYGYNGIFDDATLYGSLRTVDDSTENQYTLDDYVMDRAANSAEQSINISSPYYDNHSMTFTPAEGYEFNKGKSYYLWLYTRNINHRYLFEPSSSAYLCSIDYDIKTYTVSYDTNGGSGNIPDGIVPYNNSEYTITSIIPSRGPITKSTTFNITGKSNYNNGVDTSLTATKTITTRYTFKGWSKSKTSTSEDYSTGCTYNVTEDTKLYAVWTSKDIITYSDNTLESLPVPFNPPSINRSYTLKLDYNDNNKIATKAVHKNSSYEFIGWGENKDSTSKIGDETAYTSATTVYAIWKEICDDTTNVDLSSTNPIKNRNETGSYYVTLDANEGQVSSNSLTAKIYNNYKFIGWSTSTNKDGIIGNTYVVTKDTTLYAIWDTYSATDSIDLPAATKEGYKFAGWSNSKDSGDFVSNPYIPTNDITLYAIYKPGRNIKAFLYHGGEWYRIMIDGI